MHRKKKNQSDRLPDTISSLDNIRQRLELMCGGSLALRSRSGGGTAVTLTIPDGAAPQREP